jgi:hypothetical protein
LQQLQAEHLRDMSTPACSLMAVVWR